jgi:hypothetical protein
MVLIEANASSIRLRGVGSQPRAQEKALQVLAGPPEHAAPWASPAPRAHRIRHADRGQLASPMQLGQRGCIAAIGLHPVAGPARDQRRRDHVAVLAEPFSSR